MINLVECKKCRGMVADYAKTCPACGTQDPASKSRNVAAQATANTVLTTMMTVGVIILVLFTAYAVFTDTPAEKRAKEEAKAVKAATDKKAGFHCLNSWDGSHREVVRAVKNQLRDPSSFEHVQTRITPMSESGEHRLTMTYRAKNGFGALTGGLVVATVRNATCSAQVLSIE